MERSFLEYSMSVIVSRALPDVRDGLKPVHRRILYGMSDTGLRPDRPHAKCAKVVGDVMGRFHPHGDMAIYDALARMAQDFSLRHPLIDGHGNFGAPGPDAGPAAMRYTECRLAPLALALLDGIDEGTVDFIPNYDGNEVQPVVLPARFPNLLVNGSQGIAVGMATNIPPHNLGGGHRRDPVSRSSTRGDARRADAVRQGSGLPDRRAHPRPGRDPRRLPDRARLGEAARRRRDHRVPLGRRPDRRHRDPVPDLGRGHRDEDRRRHRLWRAHRDQQRPERLGGRVSRLVITLEARRERQRRAEQPLQAHAAADELRRAHARARRRRPAPAQPRPGHLRPTSRTRSRSSHGGREFRLRKALARAHIVEGLLRAIDMLDAVIARIRASEDRPEARANLMQEPFSFSEEQANHILDMTLGRLTRLGRSELETEMAQLRETIAELEAILGDPAGFVR